MGATRDIERLRRHRVTFDEFTVNVGNGRIIFGRGNDQVSRDIIQANAKVRPSFNEGGFREPLIAA